MAFNPDRFQEGVLAEITELKDRVASHERRIENLIAANEDWQRQVARLVAERERLLWLACQIIAHDAWHPGVARCILTEHGYDEERIERVAQMPEPAVPK